MNTEPESGASPEIQPRLSVKDIRAHAETHRDLADAIDSVQGMPLDEGDPQTRGVGIDEIGLACSDQAYRARNRAIIRAVCGEVDYASEIRKWHDRLGRSDDGRRLQRSIAPAFQEWERYVDGRTSDRDD